MSESQITLITLMMLIKHFHILICAICAIRGICGSDITSRVLFPHMKNVSA